MGASTSHDSARVKIGFLVGLELEGLVPGAGGRVGGIHGTGGLTGPPEHDARLVHSSVKTLKHWRTQMSPKSDGFRLHALTAEASAREAADPEVKRRFEDIARSWHALAEMADKGQIVKVVEARQSTKPSDGS